MRQLLPAGPDIDSAAELEAVYALPGDRHVRTNFVTSLDGAVELDGRSGSLGGPADKAAFAAMRATADVILVGAGTVRAERYGPVQLDEEAQERRAARAQDPLPRIAVVTAHGSLDPDSPLFKSEAPPILVTCAAALDARPDLAAAADVIVCGQGSVDLGGALDALAARGLMRVLCEGGPTLFWTLLENGLVDENCLTFSPVIAGAGRRRLSGDLPLAAPARFELRGLLEGDGLLLARYRRA